MLESILVVRTRHNEKEKVAKSVKCRQKRRFNDNSIKLLWYSTHDIHQINDRTVNERQLFVFFLEWIPRTSILNQPKKFSVCTFSLLRLALDFIALFTCLSVCLFAYLRYMLACLPACLPLCLLAYLPACLPARPPVCSYVARLFIHSFYFW